MFNNKKTNSMLFFIICFPQIFHQIIKYGNPFYPLRGPWLFFFNEGIENMQNLEQIQAYFQPNQTIIYEDEANLKNFYLGLRYKLNGSQSLVLKFNLE